MAVITNYTTLQTAVADYLARDNLTTFIPNFVQNWEERFYREPLNWASWMEAALSVTVASSVAAVPATYLGLKIAYVSGLKAPPLKRISLEQLYERYPRDSSSGTARYIARNGVNFEFGPIPENGTVIAGTYYSKPTNLRSDGDGANFLTTDCPDLCLYGSLLEAEPFIKNDKRLAVWGQMYSVALEAYRDRFRTEDYSGSAPHTVAV